MSAGANTSKDIRSRRVAERLRSELNGLLLRGELRDPCLQQVTAVSVQVGPDLRSATIYLRGSGYVQGSGHSPDSGSEHASQVLAAVSKAKGTLRSKLAPRLQLRYMPDLRFKWDESIEAEERMEEIFREIHAEQSEKNATHNG